MKFVFPAVAWVALSGCGPTATEADVAKAVFGSQENLNAVKRAAKVTACRLTTVSPDADVTETLASYKEGKWLALSPSQAERFRDVLSAPGTYDFDYASSCEPVFAVRVRFEDEGKTIDTHLCLKCSQIAVTRDGQIVGAEEFRGGKRKLIALCKELFPDDAEIQNLNR